MNWIKNWFRTRTKKFDELEAKYEALDIIHSSLVELYEELREENEELKSKLDELNDRNIIDRLVTENGQLKEWCEKILEQYGKRENEFSMIPYYIESMKEIPRGTKTTVISIPPLQIVNTESILPEDKK